MVHKRPAFSTWGKRRVFDLVTRTFERNLVRHATFAKGWPEVFQWKSRWWLMCWQTARMNLTRWGDWYTLDRAGSSSADLLVYKNGERPPWGITPPSDEATTTSQKQVKPEGSRIRPLKTQDEATNFGKRIEGNYGCDMASTHTTTIVPGPSPWIQTLSCSLKIRLIHSALLT